MRPDEYPHVGALLLRAYDAVGEFDDWYRSRLGDPATWVAGSTAGLVAVDDHDVPIGCVAFVLPGDAEFEPIDPPPGDAGFRFLAVDPDRQGSGAGRALVRACIDLARDHGCRRIAIHSMEFMRSAHRLYESLGFDRRPDLDVMFPSGGGIGFSHDLVPDASDHFPPPGPVPDQVPWYEDAWGLLPDRHQTSP